MLKEEFEELIGRKATDAEYERANALYMAAGNMAKQDVCREIKEHPFLISSGVVSTLVSSVNGMNRLRGNERKKNNDLQRVLLSAGELLAEDESIWSEIAEVVGPTECIRHKIEHEIILLPADLEYIKENLR